MGVVTPFFTKRYISASGVEKKKKKKNSVAELLNGPKGVL